MLILRLTGAELPGELLRNDCRGKSIHRGSDSVDLVGNPWILKVFRAPPAILTWSHDDCVCFGLYSDHWYGVETFANISAHTVTHFSLHSKYTKDLIKKKRMDCGFLNIPLFWRSKEL